MAFDLVRRADGPAFAVIELDSRVDEVCFGINLEPPVVADVLRGELLEKRAGRRRRPRGLCLKSLV